MSISEAPKTRSFIVRIKGTDSVPVFINNLSGFNTKRFAELFLKEYNTFTGGLSVGIAAAQMAKLACLMWGKQVYLAPVGGTPRLFSYVIDVDASTLTYDGVTYGLNRVELGRANVFQVPSNSKPGVKYIVAVMDNGRAVCDCDGFKYRSTCRHVDEILGVVTPERK